MDKILVLVRLCIWHRLQHLRSEKTPNSNNALVVLALVFDKHILSRSKVHPAVLEERIAKLCDSMSVFSFVCFKVDCTVSGPRHDRFKWEELSRDEAKRVTRGIILTLIIGYVSIPSANTICCSRKWFRSVELVNRR